MKAVREVLSGARASHVNTSQALNSKQLSNERDNNPDYEFHQKGTTRSSQMHPALALPA